MLCSEESTCFCYDYSHALINYVLLHTMGHLFSLKTRAAPQKLRTVLIQHYTLSLCFTREFLVNKETVLRQFSRSFLCLKETCPFFNIINILLPFHDSWEKGIETLMSSMSCSLDVFRIAAAPWNCMGRHRD